MKKTIQILLCLLLMFLVPMLTSWLLDWHWITAAWPRIALVIILMIIELLIGGYIFKLLATGTSKPQN